MDVPLINLSFAVAKIVGLKPANPLFAKSSRRRQKRLDLPQSLKVCLSHILGAGDRKQTSTVFHSDYTLRLFLRSEKASQMRIQFGMSKTSLNPLLDIVTEQNTDRRSLDLNGKQRVPAPTY